MKRLPFAALCSVLLLTAAAHAAPATKPAPVKKAYAVFEVAGSPFPFIKPNSGGEPDAEAVRDLLLGERVALALGDQFHANAHPWLQGGIRSVDRGAVWLEAQVDVGKSDADARKVLTAWADALRDAVITTGRPEIERLQDMLRGLADTRQQLKEELSKLQEQRNALRGEAGVSDISREAVSRTMERLEAMKQELEVNLAGKDARLKAVREQIAKAAQRGGSAGGRSGGAAQPRAARQAALAEIAHLQAQIAELHATEVKAAAKHPNDSAITQMQVEQEQLRAKVAVIQAAIADAERDDAFASRASPSATTQPRGMPFWQDADPIAEEMDKIVAARQQALERLKQMVDSGAVSQAELAQAEAALAEAKVQALSRRNASPALEASADLMAKLNTELVTLGIEAAELHAKYDYVQGELDRLRKARVVEIAERVQNEIDPALASARRRLDQAQGEYESIDHKLRSTPTPDVRVHGLTVAE